VQGH
jgi:potassium channel subfamily K